MGGTQLLTLGQSYFWSASTHAPNIVDKVVYGKVITSNRKQNENATKSTMSTKQKSKTKPKAKGKRQKAKITQTKKPESIENVTSVQAQSTK